MLKQKSKSKVRDAQSACRDAPKPFLCVCVLFLHVLFYATHSPETNVHRRVRTDTATGLCIHIVVVSFRSHWGSSRSAGRCPAFTTEGRSFLHETQKPVL